MILTERNICSAASFICFMLLWTYRDFSNIVIYESLKIKWLLQKPGQKAIKVSLEFRCSFAMVRIVHGLILVSSRISYAMKPREKTRAFYP